MFILDASVLLSPYSLAILDSVDSSSFAIGDTLGQTVQEPLKSDGDLPESFHILATYYGLKEEYRKGLREWLNWEIRERQYETVTQPKKRREAPDEWDSYGHLRDHLHSYFTGDGQIEVSNLLSNLLAEQIWGVLQRRCPMMAIGSPASTMWDTMKQAFDNQSKEVGGSIVGFDLASIADCAKVLPQPITEFRRLQIPLTVLASLGWWLIDILAPSRRVVGNLDRETSVGLFRFVAFSFETTRPVVDSGKSPT